MKVAIQVMYHKDADHDIVDGLVQNHGSKLDAAIAVQKKRGGPEQAAINEDGYILSAHSRESASAQGMQPTGDIVVIGMPEDCELANLLNKAMESPGSVVIDLDQL